VKSKLAVVSISGGKDSLATAELEVIVEMSALLAEYMEAFPAFRSKPQGGPNSPARKEQLADIRREDRTREVLKTCALRKFPRKRS